MAVRFAYRHVWLSAHLLPSGLMFRNYLTIAWRNVRRQPLYASINVLGLAIGLACFVLITLYVQHERQYDRHHVHAEDLYRIAWHSERPQTRTPHPMAEAMVADFREVEAAVSLTPIWGPGLTRPTFAVRHEEQRFEERDILAVDTTFLDVFTVPFVHGDPETALHQPGGIILTESTARKYFGDANPLGKDLHINEQFVLNVTGVVEDVPATAHFRYDLLVSYVTMKLTSGDDAFYTWDDFGHYNYLRLAPNADVAALEDKLLDWSDQYIDWSEGAREAYIEGRIGFRLQPITDIHLYSNLRWELGVNGNATYVYAFWVAAILILLIACINFMNLATARSMERAKEVGVRKALGAERKQLIRQFLGESMLLSGLAAALSIGLVFGSLPTVEALTGLALSLDTSDPNLWLLIVGTALVVGFISGSYPAFALSRFAPTRVLKGAHHSRQTDGRLRQGLVVLQFTASTVLLVATFVVQDQMTYLQARDKGFEAEQVVVLPVKEEGVRAQYEVIKAQYLAHPAVHSVTAVSNVPGGRFNQNPIQWRESDERVNASDFWVDPDFVETMGLSLVAGRNFSRDRPADVQGETYIINEAAARQLGWDPATAIGKEVRWETDPEPQEGRIVGVVADFHYKSLHQTVAPLIMQVDPGAYNYLLVRFEAGAARGALSYMAAQWEQFSTAFPFSYSFLSEDFAALYAAEAQTKRVLGVFSALAILIACLGLFGLVTFATQQRRKEVGIRKVLGASSTNIVLLLTKQFSRLVVVACAIAFPLAYWGMEEWLTVFPYRIDVSVGVFVWAGGIILGIALLISGYQALKAALLDPVHTLRYE